MSRDPIEQNLEIQQAQLRGFSRSFAQVEWLLLILVMLYLFVTRPEMARDVVVIGILSGFAVLILILRFSGLFASRTSFKITVQILVMVAFLTGILSVAGRETSALVNLYLLPIVTAALALGKRATAVVMTLVIGCYLLIATLTAGVDALNATLATQTMGVLAPFALVAFLTTLLAENIHTTKARIRALSDRDELTSLYNIRAFSRLTEREHDLAARSERNYALLMVDVENLKTVNDAYGHEAGNRTIQLVADALLRVTRSIDIVARLGGDEFVIYLPDVDKAHAEEVAQQIRNVVFSTTLELDVKMVRVKVNVGVATFPEDGNELQSVMTAADRAMYKDMERREPPKGELTIQKL